MAARYPPFPVPYGPLAGSPWGPPGPSYGAGMPFAYPTAQEALAGYGGMSVSPAMTQNPVFTPRSASGPFSFSGGGGIAASNGDQGLDPTRAYSRFPVDTRRG
jgi:hypothetical protein